LSARSRELAILELAARRRSLFEWYAHEAVGRQIGLSKEELNALQRGAPSASLSGDEALVRDVVASLIEKRDLDDALFEVAKRALGEAPLMELVALVGYYDLLALSLTVCRTPLPEGIDSPFISLG